MLWWLPFCNNNRDIDFSYTENSLPGKFGYNNTFHFSMIMQLFIINLPRNCSVPIQHSIYNV